MVRLNLQLVTVDHSTTEHTAWSVEKIEKSNPTLLTSYASVARSGGKTIFGEIASEFPTDDEYPEDGQTQIYSCEIEPTVSFNKQCIDLRIALESPQLGKSKLEILLNTALTAKDGTPTIIELGHPSSGTRTHLLVIHSDIITPDGSFYRDRFKPIEP